jgi:hypothetical protein
LDRDLAQVVLNPQWKVFESYLGEARVMAVNALLLTRDADETNILRGQIKELDILLRLNEQAKRFKAGQQ